MKISIVEQQNILIAEFMEFQKTSLGWYDSEENLNLPNNNDNTFDDLLFDKDWNWLMSVVEKCLIGEAESKSDLISKIYEGLTNCNKRETYNACIEFIEWFNTKEN